MNQTKSIKLNSMDSMITYGTESTNAEEIWKLYEYVASVRLSDVKCYIEELNSITFLTKRQNHSFLLRCVGKTNNVYQFNRYIVPFYNRHEADIILHLPSDAYDAELDIKSNSVTFRDNRFAAF